jgi:hypothetical protein
MYTKGVLHFEMFSGHNLLERFDPDKALFKKWIAVDTDANAFAEAAHKKLEGVPGLAGVKAVIDTKQAQMAAADTTASDPTLWANNLDDALLDALSRVVVQHVSEWDADWKAVIDLWFREWSAKKAKLSADNQKSADQAVEIAKAFKLAWKWPKLTYRKPALATKNDAPAPFYYHPVRLLNWLNGLKRTVDFPLAYHSLTTTPFDISPRKGILAVAATTGATSIIFTEISLAEKATRVEDGKTVTHPRNLADLSLLTGTRFKFADTETVHTVTAGRKVAKGWEADFTPALTTDQKKGASVRVGLYAWKWTADFSWETPLV